MAHRETDDLEAQLAPLRWPLRLTWAGLLAERLVSSLWPLGAVVMVLLAGLMLGVHDVLPLELLWAGGVIGVLALGWGILYALRRFQLPSRGDALLRLDETLPGRPIDAVLDAQASGADDPASAALWKAHQARMAQKLRSARAVPAHIETRRRDPYALRFVAILVFAVGLIYGSVWRIGSVTALVPEQSAAASGPVWEGWVEPPRYTGKPTLYLNDQDAGTLSVPMGSLVTVRFYGEIGVLTLSETVSARVGEVPPASDPTQDFVVRQEGMIEIAGPSGRVWTITVLSDSPPLVRPEEDIETTALGEMTLTFTGEDDYGIASGEARFTLDLARVDRRFGLTLPPEPRPELVVALPVPIAGDRTFFKESLVEDFSQHPWANLPVSLELSVLDSAEQEGLSDRQEITLPGRRFFDPLAAAIIEMRRDILWNRENVSRAAQILRTSAHRPNEIFRSETIAMRAQRLIRRIETLASYPMDDEIQDDLAKSLWDLALIIEEGDLADALARLERARERLEEAMRNGATPEEIAELMRELREATDDYLRQLSRQAELNAEENDEARGPSADQEMLQLSQDDIQRMMDRIQELMEQGRMAEAEQAMRELQELLENLRMTQNQDGSGQNPGQQAMEGLSETLREQQGLSDEAFRDLQEQGNPGGQSGESQSNGGQGEGQNQQQGQPGKGQGQGQAQGQPGDQEGDLGESLADRQRALRDELRRQQRNLPGGGTAEGEAARDALDEAGRAMDRAEDALRDQDYGEAIDNQSQAMDALRDGIRNLGEAMAQQQQDAQPGQGQANADRPGEQLDPLGREQGGEGAIGTDENMLQGEDAYRRAQELLDEIRRRSAEAERPEDERNYLNRLLDRF